MHKNELIVLVGPSAVGKTYWSDQLISLYDGRLRRIKNTTTRPPRDEIDKLSYDFISKKEFEKGIKKGKFLEHDYYLGNYYGSSSENIKTVLRENMGIFALTPNGVKKLYKHRDQFKLIILLLVPVSKKVLMRNFLRRGITDKSKQKKLIKKANKFKLPKKISHQVVRITGNTTKDLKNIIKGLLLGL